MNNLPVSTESLAEAPEHNRGRMHKQVPFHQEGRANTQGLADYYQVSLRTVRNWVGWHIIIGQMVAGERIFNVADCNEALSRYTHEQNRKEVK